MESIILNRQIQDRKDAGELLASRLSAYKRNDAIVVGIPHGGVCVAAAIAETLSLPLEVMPCRKIKDPSDPSRSIGSVSEDEVFLHDCARSIPQDYIYHQISLLRNAIAYERELYYGSDVPPSFQYRTVILVDDILKASDTMMACIHAIRKQKAMKIVVAVPLVTAEAARVIRNEADEIIFLKMESSLESPSDRFVHFPRVDESEVRELLHASKQTVRMYE